MRAPCTEFAIFRPDPAGSASINPFWILQQTLGIDIRAGLHTGEVELMGEDVGGIAVHIGARVSALAEPGEVLVSSTVKDLVAGAGIDFHDRGAHSLKGVPGEWRLFRVLG